MQNIADLVKRKVKEAYGTELDDDRLKEYLDYYKSKVNFSARAVKDAVTPSPEYLERYKSFKGMGDAIKSNLNQLIPSNEAFEQARKGDFTALTKASMGAALNAPMLGVLKGVPNTEFSKAHKIAQKHAALPVEQGGLGLHPDNTAMDRAKALGFDTDAYHGTSGTFDEFDVRLSGLSGVPKTGKDNVLWASKLSDDAEFYASHSKPKRLKELQAIKKPSKEEFEELSRLYDDFYSNKIGLGDKELNIMPLRINLGNKNVIDTNGKPSTFKSMGKELSKSDYDSLVIKNANPGFASQKDFLKEYPYSEYYAIKDPKNIRSRFAAFDPFKKDSANILASILAGTTLASQMDNKKRKNR